MWIYIHTSRPTSSRPLATTRPRRAGRRLAWVSSGKSHTCRVCCWRLGEAWWQVVVALGAQLATCLRGLAGQAGRSPGRRRHWPCACVFAGTCGQVGRRARATCHGRRVRPAAPQVDGVGAVVGQQDAASASCCGLQQSGTPAWCLGGGALVRPLASCRPYSFTTRWPAVWRAPNARPSL